MLYIYAPQTQNGALSCAWSSSLISYQQLPDERQRQDVKQF